MIHRILTPRRACPTGVRVITIALLAASSLAGCDSGGRVGDAEVGRVLYRERCLECHGDRGESSAEKRSRPLRDLTAMEIVQALRKYQTPSDEAPWWTEFKSGLTNAQIRDISAYLAAL